MKLSKLLLLVLCLAMPLAVIAQADYSYIYIEGDQETPIYVKVEGKMQPRLGKNHFIISNLDSGYTHFEILFQKNEYPPQQFLLHIPKAGNRAFMLRKVNDQQFALYDMRQKKYILAGNEASDDPPPTASSGAAAEKVAAAASGLPKFDPDKEQEPTDELGLPEFNPEPRAKDAAFIDGIELNTAAGSGTAVAKSTRSDAGRGNADRRPRRRPRNRAKEDLSDLPAMSDKPESQSGAAEEMNDDLPPIPNTDCPDAMSNMAFERFALKILDRNNDNEKLKLLRKVKDRQCFSTEQVRIIANNLETQSARYEVVKMLYFHTSDQENYGRLESLFNTPFLKSKFAEILNPTQ